MNRREALDDLDGRPGRQIVTADHAREVADAFGVELKRRPGELEPIKRLDRVQPNNNALGIGVGDLCRTLADRLDGIEAERFTALGHGTTQDGLKARNLPKLRGAD